MAVTRTRRPAAQTIRLLAALAQEPTAWGYGYELGAEVQLRSGSVYPILVCLCDREVLDAIWEPDPADR
jgi:PadR family transcriptional regulator PadR